MSGIAGQPFRNSIQYPTLHAGAHRRSPPRMGVPGLVWHLAFRDPQQETDPDAVAAPDRYFRRREAMRPDQRRDSWIDDVDRYLAAIYRIARSCHEGETINRSEDSAGATTLYLLRSNVAWSKLEACRHAEECCFTRLSAAPDAQGVSKRFDWYESFQVDCAFFGHPLSIRAIAYREYWTLTIFWRLDDTRELSVQCETTRTKENLARAARIIDIYEKIGRYVEWKSQSYWNRAEVSAEHVLPPAELPFGTARQALIDDFRGLVEDTILSPALRGAFADDGRAARRIGLRFADFVGQIFGVETDGLPHPPSDYPTEKAPLADPPIRVVRPGQPRPRMTIHGRSLQRPLDTWVSARVLDAFWPAIRTLHTRVDDQRRLERFNEHTEVVACRFQSSRAIYVSTMGRMNAPDFREHDPVVYTLVVNYRAHWQLGRLVERLHHTGTCRLAALWDFAAVEQAYKDMWHLRAALRSTLTSERLTDGVARHERELSRIEDSVFGTLSYRLIRARYYIAQVEDSLSRFRQGRIVGFQRYDEFIYRRLSPSFDFLARTQALHQDLRADFDLGFERSINMGIRGLLDRAEYFIAAPVAYYAGVMLHSVLDALGHHGPWDKPLAFGISVSAVLAFFLIRAFTRRG